MDLENIFDDELSDALHIINWMCNDYLHYSKECFLATLVALHLTPVSKSVGAVSN